MSLRLVSVYGVWLTEARYLPSEDEPPERYPVIIRHYLGLVRFDAWQPPFKPGWISVGVPPEER
jgi:hypothetical protein